MHRCDEGTESRIAANKVEFPRDIRIEECGLFFLIGLLEISEGVLSVIDSQVDPTNGQARMRAIFANPERALWPGSLVSTRLLVRIDHAVTVVPAQAVMRGQNGEYVYVVKSDNTVELRPLAPGASVDGYTAVHSGVTAGEVVVIDGQARIAPGTRVDAKVSAELIVTMFSPGSPLHDGAIVVREDTIIAASCILPLSSNPLSAISLGTRHRKPNESGDESPHSKLRDPDYAESSRNHA